MEPIYLDYNATTPLDPQVSAAMIPFLGPTFGNPSSLHSFGREAMKAILEARRCMAGLLHCDPDEIVFTSGGSEANNLAIKGAALANRSKGIRILTSAVEHPAVSEVCLYLKAQGFEIIRIPVDGAGIVDPDAVRKAIRPGTILISIMHANNETGSIQPVAEIGRIARECDILFHTDAAQSVGKIPVDVRELSVDLLSVAGHKMYAPKGTGALFIRRGVLLEKLIHGAGHEMNLRAGTENVPGIAGLGKAAEIIANPTDHPLARPPVHRSAYPAGHTVIPSPEIQSLRDLLHNGIREAIPGVKLNGHPEKRLPNTLNLGFPGMDAGRLLAAMPDIAASAGAACHAGENKISGVLAEMNVPVTYARGAIRFSLGRMTTEEEIRRAVPVIADTCRNRKRTGGQANGRTGGRLTEFAHGLGCSCKAPPDVLEKIVASLPPLRDTRIIVGPGTSDDASVFRLSQRLAMVQTVDVIPPVVDDPLLYGAIAAANAISDIYAMGARPLYALNIMGFPEGRIPAETLKLILQGAAGKAAEAGIEIVGGHSLHSSELWFGLTVTGAVNPQKILRNQGLQPGDALVLTKPLGTGILSLSLQRGFLTAGAQDGLCRSMASLNRTAAELMAGFPVHACTDVTGFGLLGHVKEMTGDKQVNVELELAAIPVLEQVWECCSAGLIPGATHRNLEFADPVTDWPDRISETERYLLGDPQTSGGLLIGLPFTAAERLVRKLRKAGIGSASVVGRCIAGSGRIRIMKPDSRA